jgi:hypothetical protein
MFFLKKIVHNDDYFRLVNYNDWPRWSILNHLSFYIVPFFMSMGDNWETIIHHVGFSIYIIIDSNKGYGNERYG